MAVNERDDRFADEDARLAALYRQASTQEPPEHVSRAVVNDARAALRPCETEARIPWWRMWRLPVAFAAVAVLSVSVVVMTREESGEPLVLAPPSPGPAPQPREQSPTVSTQQVPADLARQERKAAAPEDRGEPARERDRPERARTQGGRADMPEIATRERSPGRAEESPTSPPPSVAAAPPAPAPVPFPAASGAAAEASAPPASSASSMDGAANPQPRSPLETRAFAKRSDAARESAAGEAKQEAPRSAALAGLLRELEPLPPARWLERISTLRREGRREDADALLVEFRRRFPDEPVPPALGERP